MSDDGIGKVLKTVNTVLGNADSQDQDAKFEVKHRRTVAEGSYNEVDLISFTAQWNDAHTGEVKKSEVLEFIYRKPRDFEEENAWSPYRVENEVAWMQWMKTNHPSIPVPAVYDYSTGPEQEEAYIAMEYIQGQPISEVWNNYTMKEKRFVARKIAGLLVDMADIHRDHIGGLNLDFTPGPTVEAALIQKERDDFDGVGPCQSVRDFILACWDREITFYEDANGEAILDFLEETETGFSADDFLQKMRNKRDELGESDFAEEPLVVCHGDIAGRNIIVDGVTIKAVIDWEFAASRPLSELFGEGISVMGSEHLRENEIWDKHIRGLVTQIWRSRGREESEVKLLDSPRDDLWVARKGVPRRMDFDEPDTEQEEDQEQEPSLSTTRPEDIFTAPRNDTSVASSPLSPPPDFIMTPVGIARPWTQSSEESPSAERLKRKDAKAAQEKRQKKTKSGPKNSTRVKKPQKIAVPRTVVRPSARSQHGMRTRGKGAAEVDHHTPLPM